MPSLQKRSAGKVALSSAGKQADGPANWASIAEQIPSGNVHPQSTSASVSCSQSSGSLLRSRDEPQTRQALGTV